MKDHVYHYDRVVVGSGLNSLLYCYRTQTPILIEKIQSPFYFDETEGDFSFLGLHGTSIRTVELWNRLYILLSMGGFVINPLPVQNIRIDEGVIVYVTTGNKRITICVQEVLYFEKEREKYLVYDWFAVKSGGKHDFEKLEDPENFFVQFLRFHPSLRKNVRKVKDVVTTSIMTKDQIENVAFSEGMARLKTTAMMKEAGIKGKANGVSKRGYNLFYAVKIEHSHREVMPQIKYQMPLKKILNLQQTQGRLWNLTKSLFTQTIPST